MRFFFILQFTWKEFTVFIPKYLVISKLCLLKIIELN